MSQPTDSNADDYKRRTPYLAVARDVVRGAERLEQAFSTREAAERFIIDHNIGNLARVVTRHQWNKTKR